MSGHALFPAGSTLMTSGDFGVAMYVILSGTVAVRLITADGHTHAVATLGAGEIVGEMSLMTGARRNATVIASSAVAALEITKVALEEILVETPELVERFGERLAIRQAELDRIAAEPAPPTDITARIRRFFHSAFAGRRDNKPTL
ncbi:MAG: cyclic nucleotide-binding domain-containing protein [Alphaproteobacteria bacterium]